MSLDPPKKTIRPEVKRAILNTFRICAFRICFLWMAGIFVDHLFMVPIAWLLEAEDLRALKSVNLLEI